MKNNTTMTIEAKQEYQWNQSWANPIAHTDVNAVVQELKEIQEVRGEITPEVVVESARNKNSVLHAYFLWDDKVAADRYRKMSASDLLSRIEIKVVKDGEAKIIKAFDLTTRGKFSDSSVSYKIFDSSSSSSRAKQIAAGDLSRIINRLDPFPEYKVVVTWLKKTAVLLASIEPKESTETKKEVKPVLSAAV